MACAEGQRDSKAVNSVPAAVHLNGLESGCKPSITNFERFPPAPRFRLTPRRYDVSSVRRLRDPIPRLTVPEYRHSGEAAQISRPVRSEPLDR